MFGAEIYNEKGELYYSSKQSSKLSIILHSRLKSISCSPNVEISTGIPNDYSCLPFTSHVSGEPGVAIARKGGDGTWKLVGTGSCVLNVWVFSNYKPAIQSSGRYGVKFFDENGVCIFDHNSKNLRVLTTANTSPYDGDINMPHPVACCGSPTWSQSRYHGTIGFPHTILCYGKGNTIKKAKVYGFDAAGESLDGYAYPEPILYIDTSNLG